MTRFFRHPWGWTTLAPLLCAVHCLVTPILITVAPILAPGGWAEWSLLALTAAGGTIALGAGARTHGDLRSAGLVAVGLLVWIASLLHVFHPLAGELTTAAAASTVALGLIWNSRLHCAYRTVACHACAERPAEAGPSPAPSPSPGAAVEAG